MDCCGFSEYSSFPTCIIHKGGNVGIFVLHKFENELDTVTGQMNFYSLQLDKCKYRSKFIHLNLFPLEVIQKMPTLSTLCITGVCDGSVN